jgi:hypothetical protein
MDFSKNFQDASTKAAFLLMKKAFYEGFDAIRANGIPCDEEEAVAAILGGMEDRQARGRLEPLAKVWYKRWARGEKP